MSLNFCTNFHYYFKKPKKSEFRKYFYYQLLINLAVVQVTIFYVPSKFCLFC